MSLPNIKIGDPGSAEDYKKDPKGQVGFWLMSALSVVLGILLTIVWMNNTAANNRADQAETNVVVERAKRDADKETYDKRLEFWINKALEAAKERGKSEAIGKIQE